MWLSKISGDILRASLRDSRCPMKESVSSGWSPGSSRHAVPLPGTIPVSRSHPSTPAGVAPSVRGRAPGAVSPISPPPGGLAGPRREITAPSGDVAELSGDVTPPSGEVAPARRNVTPPRRNVTPPRRDVTPPRRDATPPSGDVTPSRRDVAPASGKGTFRPNWAIFTGFEGFVRRRRWILPRRNHG